MRTRTLYILLALIVGFWLGYAFYDYNLLHEELTGKTTTTLEIMRAHAGEIAVAFISLITPIGYKLIKENKDDSKLE